MQVRLWISVVIAVVAANAALVAFAQVRERAATAQTLEQQVAALQESVGQLQAQVQLLNSQIQRVTPPPGDHYLTSRSPSPGWQCTGFALSSPNSILARTKFVKYDEFPQGFFMAQWHGCRKQ